MGEQTKAPDAVQQHFLRHADDFAAIEAELWQPISIAAIARSAPKFDELVLDACCGTGASAIPTAELVGPAGAVDAVDRSSAMIDIARARADSVQRMPQLRLHVGDVAEWEPSGYDLVQCVLGVFFFAEVAEGTRRLIEHARPGGRFAVTLWHAGAFAVFDEVLAEAVLAEGGAAGEAAVAERRSRSRGVVPDTAGATAEWLHELGLERVLSDAIPRHLPLDDDLAWRLVLGTGRRQLIEHLKKKPRRRVRERFLGQLAERGIDRVDVSTITAVGYRPAEPPAAPQGT
ncbi:class I SAM-dependent DNA methyltransferase [Agromyces soli]